MKLDDAELLGFAEHAEPLRRVEPVHVTAVIQGVRAIHAAERASVCELGDERIRTVLVVHGPTCISPRSVSAARNDMTSRSTPSRGWGAYFSTSPRTSAGPVASPVKASPPRPPAGSGRSR